MADRRRAGHSRGGGVSVCRVPDGDLDPEQPDAGGEHIHRGLAAVGQVDLSPSYDRFGHALAGVGGALHVSVAGRSGPGVAARWFA